MNILKDVELESIHLVGSPAIKERFYAIVKSVLKKEDKKEEPISVKDPNSWLKEDKLPLKDEEITEEMLTSKMKELFEPFKEKLPVDIRNVLWHIPEQNNTQSKVDESNSSSQTPAKAEETTDVKPQDDTSSEADENFLQSEEAQEYLNQRIRELAVSG